jgi:hypothetical protein
VNERDLVMVLFVWSGLLVALSLLLIVMPGTRLVDLPLLAVALVCLVVGSETRKKMMNG